ncbi:MAG: diguanylate cyclase [Campylobacterota bacterium]|nr:diguanylate cyclase [Campylobacterota bacterium]
MIILNYDYIKLKVVEDILKDSSFDYLSIPILVENGDILYDDFKNSLLLYDLVNFKDELEISLNKLKFCKSLYQKELKHKDNIQQVLYIDALTKFPNREKFISDIKKENDNVKSIAIIDIQDFKSINDFYGLKIGDNLLKKIAYLIEETISFVKPKVVLYKFASDLYCLKNKSLEKDEFENIITFVLGAIDSEIFKEGEYDIDVKATAGITFSSKKNKLITKK